MIALLDFVYYSTLFVVAAKLVRSLYAAFTTFVVPDICGEADLIAKYGSWAAVTGSTDGIGKAYVKQLAKRGLNVVLVSRNPEKLETVASEIESEYGVKTKIVVCNFCDGPSVYERLEAELMHIPVGILVNNVGMVLSRPYYIDEVSNQQIQNMINVNITSALMMISIVLPKMRERRRGAIVNVSSASENLPLPFTTIYTSCKAFLKHLSCLLQYETRNCGVTVQLLSPCFVKTNMVKMVGIIQRSPDFWSPDSDTYAEHAIKTLGFSEHTTGYWPHSVLSWLNDLVPLKLKIRCIGLTAMPLRKKYEKYKLAERNSTNVKCARP